VVTWASAACGQSFLRAGKVLATGAILSPNEDKTSSVQTVTADDDTFYFTREFAGMFCFRGVSAQLAHWLQARGAWPRGGAEEIG